MSGFTRRAKGLEQTFPLSGPSLHEPGELSEFVQLVHNLFGPLARIGASERQAIAVAGGAGVNNITVTQAPEGIVRVVEFAEASHDDPVARPIRWSIRGLNLVEVQLQSSEWDGAGTAPAQFVLYPLHRSVPLAPGDELRVRVAVAAGQAISADVVFIDYAAADLAWMR